MKHNYQNPKSDAIYKDMILHPEKIPFSFIYNGIRYTGFPQTTFSLVSQDTSCKDSKETTELVFSLDVLKITAVITHYFSHGATDVTVWFENDNDKNSAVLEDFTYQMRFVGENPILRGILGDHDNNYSSYVRNLSEESVHFESNSGRPTHVNFPYFNLEYGNQGTMLAIGWAGTWTADFVKNGNETIYTAKCINGMKMFLKPQEKIRTALFVTADYTVRDEFYATNYWRSWFMEHNLPKADASGAPMTPFSTCILSNDTGLINSDGSISEQHTTWRRSMERMLEEDIHVDFRWFDAGWYQAPDMGSAQSFVKGHDWWSSVGTWTLDPAKWPGDTFLESTEFAREHGMKTLMWFEPERVTYPDDLEKNWGYKKEWALRVDGYKATANSIGNEECRKWTTDRICKTLRDNKVEMYREDNNYDPAPFWKQADIIEGEGRIGISEAKAVLGHYQLWDDIIATTSSTGGCAFVDSCASGGGRNDLESMRRAVPLFRSDADRTMISLRLSMTTSINKWLPFCGATNREKSDQHSEDSNCDIYTLRASYLPCFNDIDSQFYHATDRSWFEILRFGLKEWRKVNPYLLKDFYVLTPWHSKEEDDTFTSYAFIDPETEKGVLFTFSQIRNQENTLTLDFPFAKKLTLIDEDTNEEMHIQDGKVTINFAHPREAKLFWINIQESK